MGTVLQGALEIRVKELEIDLEGERIQGEEADMVRDKCFLEPLWNEIPGENAPSSRMAGLMWPWPVVLWIQNLSHQDLSPAILQTKPPLVSVKQTIMLTRDDVNGKPVGEMCCSKGRRLKGNSSAATGRVVVEETEQNSLV